MSDINIRKVKVLQGRAKAEAEKPQSMETVHF